MEGLQFNGVTPLFKPPPTLVTTLVFSTNLLVHYRTSLLYFKHNRVHVLDVVKVTEDERGVRVEAASNDVLSVLERQSVALARRITAQHRGGIRPE